MMTESLPISTIEIATHLPKLMTPIQEVDEYSNRRLRIRPTRIVVRGWKPTRAPLSCYVTVEGHVIRLSDHVETMNRRSMSYRFEDGDVGHRRLLTESDLDAELIEWARDAKRRIEIAFGAVK